MELILEDIKGLLTVSDTVFGCKYNKALVHQVAVAYKAGSRQGTSAQKNRSKVRGSNKKPWRQKGTGRARSGSIKSPIWRSGGVTFAACLKDHSQKVNRKMYRGALKSILSELVRQDRLIAVDNFILDEPKTKLLVQKLKNMKLEKVLIIINKPTENLLLAAHNLHKVKVLSTTNINPVSLIASDKTLITVNAIRRIEEMLS